MEDKLVTLAILTYAKAQILKNVLENEGIETYIHNVNQIQPGCIFRCACSYKRKRSTACFENYGKFGMVVRRSSGREDAPNRERQ